MHWMKPLLAFAIAALMTGAAGAASDGPRVLIATSLGDITLQLDPAHAPATVDNFLRYVKDSHYDGTVVYRVVPGFVIQMGSYDADVQVRPVRDPIPLEANNGLSNARGRSQHGNSRVLYQPRGQPQPGSSHRRSRQHHRLCGVRKGGGGNGRGRQNCGGCIGRSWADARCSARRSGDHSQGDGAALAAARYGTAGPVRAFADCARRSFHAACKCAPGRCEAMSFFRVASRAGPIPLVIAPGCSTVSASAKPVTARNRSPIMSRFDAQLGFLNRAVQRLGYVFFSRLRGRTRIQPKILLTAVCASCWI